MSGSIAAYKAVLVVRALLRAGAIVQPVMTRSAHRFIGATTLSGLTGRPVYDDMFAAPGELHVSLGRDSDLIVVVPATADLLARLANGHADDLVTATLLCARCPVLIAPAMHPRMWEHPAMQRNVERVRHTPGWQVLDPTFGEVASGETGMGRMLEPEAIVTAVERAAMLLVGEIRSPRRVSPDVEELPPVQGSPIWPGSSRPSPAPRGRGEPGADLGHEALGDARAPLARPLRSLSGRHIVVTAGPTVEEIDPVRFLSNRSSGKMGFAIAESAVRRGARVTLITGPVALATPAGVMRVDVRSALDMQAALARALGDGWREADALVMCAAVSDYRVLSPSATKLKRSASTLELTLIPNPDLLAEIGRTRAGRTPFLLGFAVETEQGERLEQAARQKLRDKHVDAIVANAAADALGTDHTRAVIVTLDTAQPLIGSKSTVGAEIVEFLVDRLA